MNRIIDFFPPHQQQQVRTALAGSLKGIVCQRLVPTIDGGRVPALEILVNTGRVAERIIDEEKTSEIKDVVAEGGYYGMITFDQWLLKLIQEGKVSVEDAMQAVSSKHDFELAMQQAGMEAPRRYTPPEPGPESSAKAPAEAEANVEADADAFTAAPTSA